MPWQWTGIPTVQAPDGKSLTLLKKKNILLTMLLITLEEKKKNTKPGKITREASSQDWILQIINNCCDTEVLGTSQASDYTICKLKIAKEVKDTHRHIYILNLKRSTSEISNKHLLICKKETQSLQKRFRCQWQKQWHISQVIEIEQNKQWVAIYIYNKNNHCQRYLQRTERCIGHFANSGSLLFPPPPTFSLMHRINLILSTKN